MIHYLDLMSALLLEKSNHKWVGDSTYATHDAKTNLIVDRAINDVLFQADSTGKWTYLSPDWSKLSGFKLEDSLGVSFLDFIYWDDRRTIQELFHQLIEEGRPSFRANIRMRLEDGNYRCVDMYACLLLGEQQRVVGINGTLTETVNHRQDLQFQNSQSSSRHLELFFQSLSFPAGIIESSDNDIQFIYTNKAAENFYQLSPKVEYECFNRQLSSPQDYIRELQQYCHVSYESGLPTEFVIAYRHGTTSKWLSHTVCPIGKSLSSEPIFSFTAVDITESQARMERLASSETRYRSVLEALTEYVHCCSPDYKFTFANKAYCRFRQKSAEELIDIGIFDDVSPEDREIVKKHFDSLTLDRPIAVGENRTVSPDGQVRWHQWIDRAIFNDNGNLVEVQSVGRDITDRKQSEEILKQLNSELEERTNDLQKALEFESLLKRIVERIRDSLDESKILDIVVRELGQALNAAYCNTTLYDNGQIKPDSIFEYREANANSNLKQFSSTDFPGVNSQVLEGNNVCFCWKPSSLIHSHESQYFVTISPIVDDRGVLGNLCLIKHVDRIYGQAEMRLVEQVATHCAIAIRQARLFQEAQMQVEELERLNILKDDFLSTVSHELRTPITTMKMSIQMLKLSQSEEKKQQYLTTLEEQCKREANLVNDLLDLQQLQAGARSLDISQIHLQAWIPNLVYPFIPRIKERQQQLKLAINSSLIPLETEEKGLHRILTELVNNACKYTPNGGSISVTAESCIDGRTTINVSNSGVEIPPEEIERIFDKFYRIPSGDPWKQGGTGLGLALVSQLVEYLGGTIEVLSESNSVTFSVKLPNPNQG